MLIKRGSLRMQNGLQTEALDDFATAVREDPDNSDIYHHRGQVSAFCVLFLGGGEGCFGGGLGGSSG